ncbi:bifunctional aldolase/short-chain dehydrogenase [Bradyrhizobium sp. U87765 SZCCT0131]|uniref:bifunctional aldolase/short-chain dehydrogenase n=1 Tax=unclassified Bradyrhizobium TaxID=2631580 RepID=UPI001BA56A50|nr:MULTISPECIES: bifunctional aldolase/short-chain dehydrogenase [unclassified Bradyrhizobium]MBR1218878.1 bifunctional aldolase/short-chain dehydrogenase [Bradyrhizobium sp. U87765 SZCCT0131]MBR1261529.1 bifunctional aldolase/short-chain dehydrogenase [Bradyrhizobium sp. U87765 SZCCT0134]MBR1306618.1 bifunctional aldolase/short-chain dehydrogenase [Bradyrhizobium sp. U87765 SZCCT0110]MBR1317311.1 bifunctional aldolase/short-chain dehydrogenase [Bradyrhizobium sp. U87765 SZCCT0109]MBR1351013.1
MENLWRDSDAEAMAAQYAKKGVSRDLALRVYTTRLLGGDPRLVLHGGGNTSLKTTVTDLVGDSWDVLCVKGSGWDMGIIEPQGLPAVKLGALLKARKLDRLSDEDMVALQRANLIDPSSPNPSVETLLHAFLPHKFVDHTHSTAILAIADQPDTRPIADAVFGPKMGFVPYIMPGFDLAKAAAEIYEQDPSVEGLILDKHGIFTFGDTAKEAYGRMIHYVTLAEEHVRTRRSPLTPVTLPAQLAKPEEIASMLRGAVAVDRGEGRFDRMVSEFRTSPQVLEFVNSAQAEDILARGVSTPDLSIRIKTGPMILPAPEADKLGDFRKVIDERTAAYVKAYTAYFNDNDANDDIKRTMLDPMPRLTLVPGLGMFGHGRTLKDAKIAADVGEMLIEAARDAEAVGRFQPLSRADLFSLEYWSLEQAKLAGAKPKPLTGQVALVTGGAGAIGAATAKAFAREGAHVVVVDLDGARAADVAKSVGNNAIGVACDVTDPASVRAAFDAAVKTFGGVDIVVSNAGAAWEGAIATLDDVLLRKSFELNFFAHQHVAQNAVRVMKAQGTGGALLFNASKQAVNPGARFGAYGLPKAATLFLSRQYALEHGADGIRVNAVNADRIRSGLLSNDMIASRSAARGLSEKDYMSGNLLGQEVTADDVAQAFLHHALAERTTADVTTVDGGNIAAALR